MLIYAEGLNRATKIKACPAAKIPVVPYLTDYEGTLSSDISRKDISHQLFLTLE